MDTEFFSNRVFNKRKTISVNNVEEESKNSSTSQGATVSRMDHSSIVNAAGAEYTMMFRKSAHSMISERGT